MVVRNSLPDEQGRFGIYGGRFVAETLMPLILELEQVYEQAKQDKEFLAQFEDLSINYVGILWRGKNLF
jgi:tryptophan synthase beta chain